MTEFKRKLPRKPSFSQKGLDGYKFSLKNSNLEVYFVDIKQGHDNYIISKKCTHIYYIIEGKGFFDIDGSKYEGRAGVLVEVPEGVEYSYSGKMKLILIINPPWFEGNEKVTRKNPEVK